MRCVSSAASPAEPASLTFTTGGIAALLLMVGAVVALPLVLTGCFWRTKAG